MITRPRMSLHPAVEPRRLAGVPVGAVAWLAQAVALARVVNELRGHAEELERLVRLLRLRVGDAHVGLAVQHQRRRLHVLDRCDRRAPPPLVEALPRLALELERAVAVRVALRPE